MKSPLSMPVRGAGKQQFELQRVDFAAPEASGRLGGVQAGFPLWTATWTLTEMAVAKSDEWRAFLAKLRGATRRFIGTDRKRPYPIAHSAGFAGMSRPDASPFDGSATSWSETITADGDSQVTLHGLPVGLTLGEGDYIDYRYDATDDDVSGLPWRVLTRVVEGGTANGSGVVMVTCEPPIPSAVPSDAVAHLDNPGCIMALVGDQSNLDAIDRRGAIRGGTIVAVQDIRSGL